MNIKINKVFYDFFGMEWNEETSIQDDLKPSETLENPMELGEIIEAPIVVEDTIKDSTPGKSD